MSPIIHVNTLPHGQELALPKYETAQSAGMDLMAAIEAPISLAPGARMLIPTGFAMALPTEYEAQIRPRSGLAYKHGITVLNSPGTIDSDYRGEVKVLLVNLGDKAFEITRGMRIAQMIIAPFSQGQWQQVDDLDETARGSGGFGSTGVMSA